MSDSRNLPTDDGKPNPPSSGETTTEAGPQGFHNLDRRQVFITLGGVMLAMFLSSLDQTIVGTALPRIIGDLNGFEHYTWVSTAYLVTSTAMMPIVGRLTDMYGRKWFYIAGIVIFLLGSALCGLSQTMTQLILFRGFQGIGAGVMIANAFIVIGDLFPPSERGKYQGLTMAVFGLSSIIGPLLGGFITDRISWHWIFYVNLPLGIPVIAAFIRFFPSIQPVRVRHQLDYLGMAALVLCVVSLIMGLSWGGVYEWSSPHVIGSLAISAVTVIVFLVIESRAAEPIIPLSIFRSRVVDVAVAARFCIGVGMFGVIIFVPLFFQVVLGQSATNSGIVLMPMMLGMVVASTLSGQAVSRLGGHYRIQALIGLAIMSVGIYLMSRMTPDTTYARALLNTAVTGIGMGIALPLFVIAVQNAVPYPIMGVATSSVQFFQSIGQAVGLAVFGSVMTSHFTANVVSSMPDEIVKVLPPGTMSNLTSTFEALLIDPNALARLQQMFSGAGPEMMAQFLQVMKGALASAITDVFAIGAVIVVLAFAVTLFLKEVPLRRSHGPAHVE
jgi:EmrB/QacA subfamily drug resistance transporter